MTVKKLCIFIFLSFLSKSLCIATHGSQLFPFNNLTSDDSLSALGSDIHKSADLPHYVQAPHEYLRNLEMLLSSAVGHSPHPDAVHRNPHFADLETHQKTSGSHEAPDIRLIRLNPYQDQLYQDYSGPTQKHDFGNGNQDFGGWDSFQQGGYNNQGGSFGVGHATGLAALKKGKDAKALFILMAPLILLAVFGPLLATQAMIPWVTSGGLTSVTTVAGGKRRRRQAGIDPKQAAELQKRLQLFMEVQDFISKTGSQELVQEMGAAFLQCQKYSERKNKCLERVACEYTDDASYMDPEERRIGRMVLRNVLSNPSIPAPLITRLKKGFVFGRNHHGRCAAFWCGTVDHPQRKAQ